METKIRIVIFRAVSAEAESVKKFASLLEEGYYILDKTVCEDRVIYILKKVK